MSKLGLNFAYILLFSLWALAYVITLPVVVNLVLMSASIIYIASHHSISLIIPEDEGEEKKEVEVLSSADAYKFPFIGSFALFGLYLAFRYFDKETINLIMSGYFAFVGVATLTASASSFFSSFFSSKSKLLKKNFGKKFSNVAYFGDIDFRFNIINVIAFIISLVVSYFYFKTKHYMLNNIFGISFCLQGIAQISLGSYDVGAILLIGLFFYDIFWVFGTDVMVTVAKSFDGPIKLLFPRVLPSLANNYKGEFSLLGLGDIVIPGFFISLLLRFDFYQACLELNKKLTTNSDSNLKESSLSNKNLLKLIDPINSNYSKKYFHVNLFFYSLGLVTTVFVMIFFKAAQPALLYLVPACLGSSIILSLIRKETKVLLQYNEKTIIESSNKESEVVGDKKSN